MCKWGRGYGSAACWEAPALPPISGQTDADAPIVQPPESTGCVSRSRPRARAIEGTSICPCDRVVRPEHNTIPLLWYCSTVHRAKGRRSSANSVRLHSITQCCAHLRQGTVSYCPARMQQMNRKTFESEIIGLNSKDLKKIRNYRTYAVKLPACAGSME